MKKPVHPSKITNQQILDFITGGQAYLPVKGPRILLRRYEPVAFEIDGVSIGQANYEKELWSSPVGQVISIGSEAYDDPERFPHGPYCAVGDFVVFNKMEVSSQTVHGVIVDFVMDDRILMKISNPDVFISSHYEIEVEDEEDTEEETEYM